MVTVSKINSLNTSINENLQRSNILEYSNITKVPKTTSVDEMENIVITDENNISINGKNRVQLSKIFPEQKGGTKITNQFDPTKVNKIKNLFEEMSFYSGMEQEEMVNIISTIKEMENLNLLNIKVLAITLILIYLLNNSPKEDEDISGTQILNNLLESQVMKDLIIDKFSLEDLENKSKGNAIKKYKLDVFRYFALVFPYTFNKTNITDIDDIIYKKEDPDEDLL